MKIMIFKMRSKKKLSLRDLENLTGIGRSTLSRMENYDGNTCINLLYLEKIAKALNCNITDLFESEYK